MNQYNAFFITQSITHESLRKKNPHLMRNKKEYGC